MRYFDLAQPETGAVYRLAYRCTTIPGFPRDIERILIPLERLDGRSAPIVSAERPILHAGPIGEPLSMGATRNYMLDRGWRPADLE